jgi:pimeloyl-ACP methyl ester carboxylesterase
MGTGSNGLVSHLELYCETRGAGEPILLLHGFAASTFFWRRLVDDLSSDHQVVALDLKGFGQSPKPADERYSLYDQSELVTDFITSNDFRHLTLVGHSMGGGIALAVAMNPAADRRVDRLVLIDTIAYSQRLPFYIWVLSLPLIGVLAARVLPPRWSVRLVLRTAYFDRSHITEDAVRGYAEPLRSPGAIRALIRTVRLLLQTDVTAFSQRYPSITVPVLIIWGKEDRVVPIDVGRRLHRTIPGSELLTLSNSGHCPPEEQPLETLQAIRKFIRKGYWPSGPRQT